ncbi:MAG: flagellar motor switch protein FliG [Deltaproteobacteria bacterium]|nr:flagellar motor switch protein FliG [Candidatus Anaeroferrophillus wilburensis]MBN2888484.1 flagellar motor switch protein FliG [Deltaproteobacteria bacterium]
MAVKGKSGEKLSGRQKAAILLLGLGEEIAPKVLEKFTEYELQQISREISRLGNVTGELTEKIAREFVDAAGSKVMFYGGKDYLKNILSKTMGAEKTESFLEKVGDSLMQKPFGSLAHVDPRVIASFIKAEHPQTIALILAHLEPDKAAQIVTLLPEGVQADVVLRIANLDSVPREMIDEIELVLESELKTTGGMESRGLGGLSAVSELINNLDKNSEVAIMDVIEEHDPDLADEIRKLMFTFDDLIDVDDRGIQAILKEINNEDLLLALKTATEEVKEKIFNNMSQRAATMVKDDLEALGPVRLTDVEKAQQVIVKVARKLEDDGKIVIASRGGGGDVVV